MFVFVVGCAFSLLLLLVASNVRINPNLTAGKGRTTVETSPDDPSSQSA